MDILLATGNLHKKTELEAILDAHRILVPDDAGIAFEAEETGTTYLENALIKARSLYDDAGGLPVVADDSGLSVPALGGAPGVYSARYGSDEAGRDLGAAGRNELLLRTMAGLSGSDRRAFFVCCMVLIVDEYRVFTVQETFEGLIGEAPSGDGGFGYDPVFVLPDRGCSVAELDAGTKNRLSHRGRAGRRLAAVLADLEAAP